MKEVEGRIKFNKLLEEVGWQFFESNDSASNLIVEKNGKLVELYTHTHDEDFEKSKTNLIFEQKIKEKITSIWSE